MATTNYDRVGKALELLRKRLQPFVEREMQAVLGQDWPSQAARSLAFRVGTAELSEPSLTQSCASKHCTNCRKKATIASWWRRNSRLNCAQWGRLEKMLRR